MPLTKKRPGRWTLRALLPWLVGAIPVVSGVLIMHWQAQRELEARAANTAALVTGHFERILDNIAGAAQALLPLTRQPCAEATLALREQVTRGSFVRSSNLFRDNDLYCSSLFGNFSEPVDAKDYVDGSLWLMNGNSVTPGHALLAYRLSKGNDGAITTVDGDHLSSALELLDQGTTLVLQVGPNWMGEDGVVHQGPPPVFAVAPTQQASQRYRFSVHSGYAAGEPWRLMQRVAEGLAPHAQTFGDGFHVGINITADHCQDMALYDDCRDFLAAFPPGRVILTLELTERKLVVPSDTTEQLFARLQALGVMIAIDDFGTGQSSLGYLRQFKVDYLKIDQSFVAMIGVDALSLHILDSIIELSGKLGLGIVAEGVETIAQRDYLARHRVDFQQGYLFARPMPLAEFVAALGTQPVAQVTRP